MLASPALRTPPSGSGSGGIAGSRRVAQSETVNSSASTPYAMGSATSTRQAAKIRPAASGPKTAAAVNVV